MNDCIERDQTDSGSPKRDAASRERADLRGQWSRRRFGKAALAASPILLTLHGQPLRAAANCTPSGWVSGNTSMHHELQDCGGNTPAYWQGADSKRHFDGWDRTKDNRLDSQEGFPGLSFTVGGEPATLQDAVQEPGDVPFDSTLMLVRELMYFGTAALLNARYLEAYPLSEAQVAEMVAAAVLYEGYTAPSGDYLSDAEVKAFLENTMNVANWG